ncbi:MAG TPA: GTPase HflX [Nitrososphaerales archaeon]|nr:GTPase HflX [Nitrososphaerales archaeon]
MANKVVKNDHFSSRKDSSYETTHGKKVILVTYPDEFVQNEAIELTQAAGYQIVHLLTQKRLIHQQYGVGNGKAEELRDIAENEKTEMIIVDERLSSGQAHNLAKFCHQEVIDRERLILDIFNSRATTTEAKLQVKLAELKYEIPRAREAVRISLKGEQAGFMGMGEYAVDIKFRALKRQMVSIQKKLEDARRQRQLFKTSREKLNLPYVSLAGYTSSGKTTLFNKFVSETKEESPNLFTTLTTTTRSFEPLSGRRVLLSDTVGFISRLPTYMVEAFKSTLEELTYADLILLMIDSSEQLSDIQIKYQSCREVLDQLHINPVKILCVLNKIDLVPNEEILEKVAIFRDLPTISISAKTGEGTKKLRLKIVQRVFEEEDLVSEDLDERKIVSSSPLQAIDHLDSKPN